MNNENKELLNNDVEINVSEENIILAPPVELFDEAKEISQSAHSNEKFPFALQYDSNQKEFLLSMLEAVGAIVEDDDGHILATMMNMTQLAFIKQLDCVERVKTDEGINPFLAEEADKLTPIRQEDETLDDEVQLAVTDIDPETLEVQTEIVLNRTTDAEIEAVAIAETEQADGDIALASVAATARSSCSGCPTNSDMAHAQNITVETLVSGCICCPGAEQWFKVTAPETQKYTIFTTGSLDTEGELSGCCLSESITNDDCAGRVNFRIVETLCAGYEYYIKVNAKNNATGSYTLKVTSQSLAEEVLIHSNRSDGIIVLEEGKTYELPRGDGYNYLYSDGELDKENIPIYHIPMSVEVKPDRTGDKRVYWYASSIPADPVNTNFAWYDNTTKYQTIKPDSCGATKLYAYDWFERGKRGEIYVVVAPSFSQFVKASGFKICKEGTSTEISELNMKIGDYQKVIAEVSPSNATVQNVNWVSTKPEVATITPYGRIKALSYGTTTIRAEPMDGGNAIAELKVNVLGYYYISSKTDNNKVISYQNALDGVLTGVRSNRANVRMEQFIKSAKQIWRITEISSDVDGQIKAYYDEEYGFNAYRGTNGNFDCDLIQVEGNEDANVRFVDQGTGYYKIHLASDQYSGYYLTLATDGSDVRWRNTDEGDRQLWKLNVVDWEQYENEHKEYHLLCNGDTSKALRVGTRNVLEIDTPLPVRGERLSYWNRQKWTIKGEGTQKRLCSQLNNEYFLCNDGLGNAYISDNAAMENSYLTITPHNASKKLYEIKLTQSGLYLTLEYDESSQLYWCKWQAYNSNIHNEYQVWKLQEQPTENSLGVDSYSPVSETTAKILAKNGKYFSVRYYTSSTNSGKLLTTDEVSAIHNAGLKIVSVYQDVGRNIDAFSETEAHADAQKALDLASALGQPKGTVIYFAVDYDPISSEYTTIQKYFAIIKEKIGNQYEVGVYGTAKICNLIKSNSIKHSWLGQSTGANSDIGAGTEGSSDYISYDSQQKYDIKQTELTYYNEVEFDSDTAIKANYGQW